MPSCHDLAETTRQRILVVDDDLSVLELLRRALERDGYQVLTAASGQEALCLIEQHGLPHLAVVDVMMSGMSGLELCERVQAFCDLPVILLTAIGDRQSVVRGLQLYAEDYVTKPFSPRELAARIDRVLRRIDDFSYAQQPTIEIDAFLQIDIAHQCAICDGVEQPLTPTETKLLHILIRNAGQTLRSAFLVDRLWPLQDGKEDALRVYIHRLRSKIEPDPGHPQYVLTDIGVGYRFVRY
jgi:DNA-binding response OmpR family regulator